MTNYGNYDDVNGLYEEALDLATIDDEECIRCYDEIIGINCEKNIKIEILKRPTNINYFDNIDESNIIFTRTEYEEKWNEKKQKNSEFSTTIKLNDLSIGELQFHKSSRKVVKFRFFSKFLNSI